MYRYYIDITILFMIYPHDLPFLEDPQHINQVRPQSFRWFSVGPVEFAGSVCLQQEGRDRLFLRISAQNMGVLVNGATPKAGWCFLRENPSING